VAFAYDAVSRVSKGIERPHRGCGNSEIARSRDHPDTFGIACIACTPLPGVHRRA